MGLVSITRFEVIVGRKTAIASELGTRDRQDRDENEDRGLAVYTEFEFDIASTPLVFES